MNAGIPGTGLATIFYVLSSLLMPIVELGRRLAGRSSARGWGFVGRHVAVAGTLVGLALVTSAAISTVAAAQPLAPLRSFGASSLSVKIVLLTLLIGLPPLAGRQHRRRSEAGRGYRDQPGQRRTIIVWLSLETLAAEVIACVLLVRALGLNPVSCSWALVSLGLLMINAFPRRWPTGAGSREAGRRTGRGARLTRLERTTRVRRLGVMIAVANGMLAITVAALVWLSGPQAAPSSVPLIGQSSGVSGTVSP
jgi:hypothetical protein